MEEIKNEKPVADKEEKPVEGKTGNPAAGKVEKPAKARKKKKKWLKPVIILAIIAAVIAFIAIKAGNSTAGYTQEKAELRDIKTYHSFTGNIAPVEEENVMPSASTSQQVKEVLVEEGDEVKKGDVLFKLDTANLEEQIKELQASMNAASKQNSVAIALAQKTYDDYKSNMDASLNSSVIQAQSALDSSYSALVGAQQKYNTEVGLNAKGWSSAMLTATSQVDQAYSALRSAELLNDAGSTDTTKAGLNSARENYSNAVDSYEASKVNEDSNLTTLYDALITAQTSYLDALDSYNSTVTASDQQLGMYALQVEQAKAAADTTANQLKLADLQRQLNNCTVTAPRDGIVTALPAKKGDMTVAGTSMATVTSFDQMKIDIKINEYDILGVKEGKKVEIGVDALDKTYEGTISKIAKVATIDNGVSYFKSEVDFKADDDTRSGMSVEVKLPINDLSQVVTVSADAISTEKDGTAYVNVYAADGKTVTKQKVTCGATNGTYTQITDGLKEGDVVLKPITVSDVMMNGQVEEDSGEAGNDNAGATE